MVDEQPLPDFVLIGRGEYEGLKRSERELTALESAGVDNWEGYGYVNWDYVETGEGDPTKVDW